VSGDENDGHDQHDQDDEHVGTVAEEAAKLFGALSDWASDHGVEPDAGAAECRWCPVCRTVHALRQTSPEVRAQLTSAAASLLQAASAMLATAAPGQTREPGQRSGVEHIDLDDGPDWPDEPAATTNENSEEGDR
jgi:hypothetical protein